MKHHPDRNPDNKEAEEQVQGGQGSLRDPLRRAEARAYDQYGHAGVDPQWAAAGRRQGNWAASPTPSATSSATSSAAAAAAARGASIAAPTCATTSKSRWRRPRAAPRRASASRPWSNARPATAAAPSPAPAQDLPDLPGPWPGAHAAGLLLDPADLPEVPRQRPFVADPCQACHGAGRVKQHKTLSVKIPAGVDEGDRIRLSGEGEPASTAARRRPLRADPHQAAPGVPARPRRPALRDADQLHHGGAGRRDRDPHPRRPAKIKIPAETQSGKVFRLRGKGIKGVRSHSRAT
jgi:molecular chaperone DnaJ